MCCAGLVREMCVNAMTDEEQGCNRAKHVARVISSSSRSERQHPCEDGADDCKAWADLVEPHKRALSDIDFVAGALRGCCRSLLVSNAPRDGQHQRTHRGALCSKWRHKKWEQNAQVAKSQRGFVMLPQIFNTGRFRLPRCVRSLTNCSGSR